MTQKMHARNLQKWNVVFAQLNKESAEFAAFLKSGDSWKTTTDPRTGKLLVHEVILREDVGRLEAMIDAGLDINLTVETKSLTQQDSKPVNCSLVEFCFHHNRAGSFEILREAGAKLPESLNTAWYNLSEAVYYGEAFEVKFILDSAWNPNKELPLTYSNFRDGSVSEQFLPIKVLKKLPASDARIEKGLLLVAYGATIPPLKDSISEKIAKYEGILPADTDGKASAKALLDYAQERPDELDTSYLDMLGLNPDTSAQSLQDQAKQELVYINNPQAIIVHLKDLKEKISEGNSAYDQLDKTDESALEQKAREIDAYKNKFAKACKKLEAKVDNVFGLYSKLKETCQKLEEISAKLESDTKHNSDLEHLAVEKQEIEAKKAAVNEKSDNLAGEFDKARDAVRESVVQNLDNLNSVTESNTAIVDGLISSYEKLLDELNGYNTALKDIIAKIKTGKIDTASAKKALEVSKTSKSELEELIQYELAFFSTDPEQINFDISAMAEVFGDTKNIISLSDDAVVALAELLISYCDSHKA